MLAGAAVGEVIDYGPQVCELRCGIRPQVGTMCFSLTGTEHLHRRLIGMQHALLQYLLMQRVDQRLQPHTTHAYPGSKRRPRNRQTGARKDTLLPVQWQVVSIFGDQRMGQQVGGRSYEASRPRHAEA